MILILLAILTTRAFGAGWLWSGPKCSWQTPSLIIEDTQREWFNWPGVSGDAGLGCWNDDFSCGSSMLTGSFVKKWRQWFTGNEVQETFTYTTEVKRCVPDAVCYNLAGGEDSCDYSAYTFEKWRPRSCNESADFDAITEEHDVKLYFHCCDTPDWCNKEVDYTSGCTESNQFSAYMTQLNECWNGFKYDFMKDLLCDDEHGDILNYSDTCANPDGSRNQALKATADCKYRVTCAAELKEKLVEYGACACAAASDNDFSGEYIGTAMEANWARWCPGITIECAADGLMKLLYTYWRTRIRFRVALARAIITAANITNIKEKIAERLNAEADRVSVSDDTSAESVRRRLAGETSSAFYVDISSDDVTTKNYFNSQVFSNLAAIGTEISNEFGGASVTETSVASEEVDETTTGEYEGDATVTSGVGSGCVVYSFVVVTVFLFAN